VLSGAGLGCATPAGPGRRLGDRRPGPASWPSTGANLGLGVGVRRVDERLSAGVAVGPIAAALALSWAAAVPTDTALGVFVGGALLLRPLAGEASAHLVEFELVLGVGFGLGGGVLLGLLGVNGGLLEGEECLLRGHSSKQGRLNLHSAGGGIGEHKASAKTKGGAGGFQGVSARRHVVHGVGLAQGQGLAGAGEVVLVGGNRAKGVLVAGALRGNRLSAHDGFDNLSAGAVAGDHAGKAGVRVRVAGAVGNGDKPARSGDEGGHVAGGGVEVCGRAGGALDRVGKAAGLGLFHREKAIARGRVAVGGKYVHKSGAASPPVAERASVESGGSL